MAIKYSAIPTKALQQAIAANDTAKVNSLSTAKNTNAAIKTAATSYISGQDKNSPLNANQKQLDTLQTKVTATEPITPEIKTIPPPSQLEPFDYKAFEERQNKKIEEVFAARELANTAALEKSKQAALSNLTAESKNISPYFANQKNAVAGQSAKNTKNFAEYLAQRGQTNSGFGAQAEMANRMELQRGLGNLGQDEANAYAEIERQKTLAENNYLTDLNSVKNNIFADKSNALLNSSIRGEDIAYKLKGDEVANYWKRKEYDSKAAELEATRADKAQTNLVNYTDKVNTANKNTSDAEIKQYGLQLTPQARTYQDAYNQISAVDPNFTAYINSVPDIAGAISELRASGAGEEYIAAAEGARVNKILSDPKLLSQYGREYGLASPVVAKMALEQEKNVVALQLDQLGLQKAAQALALGDIELAMKEIESAYLEPGLKLKLQDTVSRIENRSIMAGISQQNADTSAYSAETGRKNSDRQQTQFESKQAEESYNDIDKHIQSVYMSDGLNELGVKTGRKVMQVQDKYDIDDYTKKLDKQGVPSQVINAVRAKYGLSKLPE